MSANIGTLNKIYEKIKELNRENELLKTKYNNDPKYARVHKRLMEKEEFNKNERKIFEALSGVKIDADEKVLSNTEMLNNDSYFERENGKFVINRFKNEQKFDLNFDSTKFINSLIVKEYINEFNGVYEW